MEKYKKRRIGVLAIVLVFIMAVGYFFFAPSRAQPAEDILYGATFTKSYAEYLGLPWREVYLATLDDLGVRSLRIGLNWDEIEVSKDQFDFSAFDWMMDEAQKREVRVILGVGQKLPRWPECRIPGWASNLTPEAMQERLFTMMRVAVKHYRTHPALRYWQVENEPLFDFGDCPPSDYAQWKKEIALVRSLDPDHLIMGTDSGELGFWIGVGSQVDVLGSSLYRAAWNPLFGYIDYPLAAGMYDRKARLLKPFVKRAIISELQLETWLPDKPIHDVPVEEQFRTMNVDRAKSALTYARETGFDEIYLWGVEWWYWLKVKGDSSMWDTVRTVVRPTMALQEKRFVPVLVLIKKDCLPCSDERTWLNDRSKADASIQPVYYSMEDPLVRALAKRVIEKAGISNNTFPITLVGHSILAGFNSNVQEQLEERIRQARNAPKLFERFEDYLTSL